MQLALTYDAHHESDADKVLRMLTRAAYRGEHVTNIEFCDARLANFRSRLSELRKRGHRIPEGERVRKGVWKYRVIL